MSARLQTLTAVLIVLGPCAFPAIAAGQDQVPTREGDIWDWRNHEPVPSQVQSEEQAEGVALPNAQQKQQTDDVESLYRQLMNDQGNQ